METRITNGKNLLALIKLEAERILLHKQNIDKLINRFSKEDRILYDEKLRKLKHKLNL